MVGPCRSLIYTQQQQRQQSQTSFHIRKKFDKIWKKYSFNKDNDDEVKSLENKVCDLIDQIVSGILNETQQKVQSCISEIIKLDLQHLLDKLELVHSTWYGRKHQAGTNSLKSTVQGLEAAKLEQGTIIKSYEISYLYSRYKLEPIIRENFHTDWYKVLNEIKKFPYDIRTDK
ncbi:unnamed protein product [Didymodactylos carnosus]|uniref:Uncharacterized protein n=1 Tax=Didymodactylos carnosus TaxID=1234261 RepID=A0A8S2CQF3_9BILA|nr:unnamed protein product [Didymodactylos carnosus]CAF3558922.1 unnamed protein product [Didymodactylos carnosus]